MIKTDVLIIGAGAVGVGIARELSKFELDVLVVEKKDDVGGDATKSCSAMISTEFSVPPFTLESKICQSSRPMYDLLCRDLDIPLVYRGSLTVAFNEEQEERIPAILKKAFDNGVYDVEYLRPEEILEMEPNINPNIRGGVWSPRDTQINPFEFIIAQAENAAENGVQFLFDCPVTGMELANDGTIGKVITPKGEIEAKYVINAAGLYCDDIAKMVGECDFKVNPRRGQFYLLDSETAVKVNHILMPVATPTSRGTLVIPTVDNNILVGPTAEDYEDKTDKRTTKAGLDMVAEQAKLLVPNLQLQDTITQFVGLRPARNPEGYNILISEKVKGYVGISGIRSSGLTGSLGIAKYTIQMMREQLGLETRRKAGFIKTRRGIAKFSTATDAEKEALIAADPLYGHIVCRCEQITEAEILQAIRRPVGARTVDAVKRRVRAGMGRCQGGFCAPYVIDILARELGVPAEEIRKRDGKSFMLAKDE